MQGVKVDENIRRIGIASLRYAMGITMDGIINIYKEKGFTSHDVVAKLRGILKQKKIGHTGTLDPDAVGVLPVCLGKATKVCELLTNKDKTYETVLKLGVNTDTQDMSGNITSSAEVSLPVAQIQEAIKSFIGEYDQIPPMYSALKVNGRKLYELAREGQEIERKPRKVTIFGIQILDIREGESEVKMEVTCSKGTYIRTLCYDIGQKLGCGGCMKELVRSRVSSFVIEESLRLSQVEELYKEGKLDSHIIKTDEMFLQMLKLTVGKEHTRLIYNGNKFSKNHVIGNDSLHDMEQVRVYDFEGNFVGIYEYRDREKIFFPVKMFL